jgi:hypothetical protein
MVRCARRGAQRTLGSILAQARRRDLVADQEDRNTAWSMGRAATWQTMAQSV